MKFNYHAKMDRKVSQSRHDIGDTLLTTLNSKQLKPIKIDSGCIFPFFLVGGIQAGLN